MANNQQNLSSDTKRLIEIVKIMSRYKVARDFTPQKMCDMFAELGPTFVKLGQLLSLHPEVIPVEYCKALESLRTDASHLVTSQIRDIISEEYGRPWHTVFDKIMPFPLGAASIAQVHEATLLDGTRVAIKIQRPDIYETMERDVRLLKKAFGIVKFKQISAVMDIADVVDEMWVVAQEEMDFEREAENIRTVRKNIEGIQYVYCPKVFDELSTKNILVMEYVGGCELNDVETLKTQGYDLSEVCTKFVNNFIKQFAEDRFFHADPHPGNVHICDGKIIWLDLGMMGRLTENDAKLVSECMRSIVSNDYVKFGDVMLNICEHEPIEDINAFYETVRVYLDKYRIVSMDEMSSTVDIFKDLYKIALEYGVRVPKTMTMFWRSMSIMESTVTALAPDTDLTKIIGTHMAAQAMVKGVAGVITKSVSHKKLISGNPLSYNGHTYDDE